MLKMLTFHLLCIICGIFWLILAATAMRSVTLPSASLSSSVAIGPSVFVGNSRPAAGFHAPAGRSSSLAIKSEKPKTSRTALSITNTNGGIRRSNSQGGTMRSAAITSNPNTINTDTGEDGGGDRWRHVKALAGAVPGVLNGLKTKVQQKALDSRKLINGWPTFILPQTDVETTIEKSLKSQDNSAKSVTRLLSMFSDRRRELVNMGLVDLHADQMAVVVSALLETRPDDLLLETVFLPWEKELPGAEFCPANAGWEDFVRSWDRSREVFVGVLVDYFHLIKKLKLTFGEQGYRCGDAVYIARLLSQFSEEQRAKVFENIHRRKIKVARVMETCTAILESEKYKQQEQRANRVLGLDYFREPREAKRSLAKMRTLFNREARRTRELLADFWCFLGTNGRLALQCGAVPLAEHLHAVLQLDDQEGDFGWLLADRDDLFDRFLDTL